MKQRDNRWPLVAVAAVLLMSCGGWQSPSPVCLEGAYLDDSGECVPQQANEHHIPFRAGYEARVTQAFHGYETHRDDVAYAVDFACEEGTPVTASRDGVVWSVRDDSDTGCPDPNCIEDANYVILDHGDGTFSAYYHLQHRGAVVEPGDQVCRGQLLGLCGETGYATGTHLHFAVLNTQWRTIPVRFAEVQRESAGLVFPRQSYVSENERSLYCDDTDYSRLGPGAFAHRGIFLESEIPMMVVAGEQETTRIEGEYTGGESHVAIHRRRVGGGEWIEQCSEVDDDGRFAFEVDWPPDIFDDGYYFVMLTGSDDNCKGPGWAWAYRVRVFDSEG